MCDVSVSATSSRVISSNYGCLFLSNLHADDCIHKLI